MNATDHADNSKWIDFFITYAAYFSNALIEKMIAELQTELEDRKTENDDEK